MCMGCLGIGELQQNLTSNVTGTKEGPLVRNRCEIHPSVLKVPYLQLCPRQNDVHCAGNTYT